MIRGFLLATVVTLFMTSTAFAFHCPKDAAAIDHALTTMELSESVQNEVKALRDQGMEQHEAGNHADAVNTLSEAMRTPLMSVK